MRPELLEFKERLELLSKMTLARRMEVLHTVMDPSQQALIAQSMTDEGMTALLEKINLAIDQERKRNTEGDPNYKPTRRDKRANKELQQLKDKIKLASG